MDNANTRISEIHCQPFQDQRPGTAGLRKKVAVFQQPHYLESFVEAILRTIKTPPGSALVIGGDGRYFNRAAIQVIIRMCAAHGIGHLIIGRAGVLATPAASNLIRKHRAHGGLILTASHNPGGEEGDFGIKFNTATGGQAPEQLTEAVFEKSCTISSYRLAELPEFDLDEIGSRQIGAMTLEVVDSVADYSVLMEELFDFNVIADAIGHGLTICFDAMHGVTGPYARSIICDRLGAPADAVVHGTPLPDFGGLHPDPNPVDARHLVDRVFSDAPPDLAAASDGDGDRNMILGPEFLLSPCDSVAVMLANAAHVPGYRRGIAGVARSMPTSRALDRVAADMGIPCFETPTGWRYFCNLLEAGLISLCGEESYGTGSNHTREKDGLWAVLFWLNLLAATKRSLPDIVREHWSKFGRHYYQRCDYFIADADRAHSLMEDLRRRVDGLAGQRAGDTSIEAADDFHYRDPVDHTESARQGIRINLRNGCRIVFRLSGTGTAGATLRVYLERLERDPHGMGQPVGAVLKPLTELAGELGRIRHYTGLSEPTAVIG